LLLAVESSCDETSVAVIHTGRVLANVVASQIKLHAEYGGVVPELATREHLRNFLPTARAALEQAQIGPKDIEVVAATVGPGLPQALMMGARAAQGFAFALQRPFIGMHHHEAHLYSPWIEGDPAEATWDDFVPNISLIVSGGHTLLVHVKGIADHEVLGGTLDDAAGECFDKTAKLIGLPYPGGPVLDRMAEQGDPSAYKFPRPLLRDPGFDFSFSGLKTSVRYFLRDNPAVLEHEETVRDLCASIRAAIVEVLVAKTIRAARQLNLNCITASGGVSCNLSLRRTLAERCDKFGIHLQIAQPRLCTDNAAMVGILAERKWQMNPETTSLDCDVNPGWQL
jgi:N6-L-threonylcarbamoyladenine synthase